MPEDLADDGPEYAAAAELWNSLSQQERTQLLLLVMRIDGLLDR